MPIKSRHCTASDQRQPGAGRVVGVHHNSAERNGKVLDTGCCIEFKLEDGRIIHGREHFFDLYNCDEFWS